MGTMIAYKRPDGKELSGYLAESTKSPMGPAVVVIQEWWGVNSQIRGVADRLANAGYTALVPDLFRGRTTLDQAEASHLMTELDFGDAASQDVAGAVKYLKSRVAKVGCMGFCMGGALTILSAMNSPEIDAAVTFYGFPPLEYVDARKIKIPLQGHWALQDQHFQIGLVDKLEAKLVEGGVKPDFYRYLAEHAFANEQAVGPGRMATSHYDPVWAQQAWDRTLTFFATHLSA